MQEKEFIMVVQFELKILSLRITVLHHSTSLMMPNSYPLARIFNPNLTTIKASYNLGQHCLPRTVGPKICCRGDENLFTLFDFPPEYSAEHLHKFVLTTLEAVCKLWAEDVPQIPMPNKLLEMSFQAIKNTRRKMEDSHTFIHDFNTLFGLQVSGMKHAADVHKCLFKDDLSSSETNFSHVENSFKFSPVGLNWFPLIRNYFHE